MNVYLATRIKKRFGSPSRYPNYADKAVIYRRSATPKRKTPIRSKKYTSKKKRKPSRVSNFDEAIDNEKHSTVSKNSSKKLAPSEKMSNSKNSKMSGH